MDSEFLIENGFIFNLNYHLEASRLQCSVTHDDAFVSTGFSTCFAESTSWRMR